MVVSALQNRSMENENVSRRPEAIRTLRKIKDCPLVKTGTGGLSTLEYSIQIRAAPTSFFPRVHPIMGMNRRIPLEETRSRAVHVSIPGKRSGVSLSSLLSTLSSHLGGRAYSALPCAGAPPPQRPLSYNIPPRPGVEIGDRCLFDGVQPDHVPPVASAPRRCRPCACPRTLPN